MQTVKGYLVDPFDSSISEIEFGEYDLTTIKRAMQCDVLDVVRLPNNDILFIDDNGLLHNSNRYFAINGQIIAGRSIIATATSDGGTISASQPLDYYLRKIRWMPTGYKVEPYMEFIPLN